MPSFSTSSKEKLNTCNRDLKRLFNEVIKYHDCTILEGRRSPERQKQLFNEGKTKTLVSNHLPLPSDAADVMPYPIDWEDVARQHGFATEVYNIAMKMGIRVRWGGNFKNFYDAPHWEIIKGS